MARGGNGSLIYNMEMLGSDRTIKLLIEAGVQAAPVLARALYEEGQLAFRDSQNAEGLERA